MIGSGVNYYSGIPGLGEITEQIIHAKNVGRHPDSNYYLNGYLGYRNLAYLNGHIKTNQKLIERICFYVQEFYKTINHEHVTNYEDFYYVLKQIEDSYRLEYENPVTYNLIKDIQRDCGFDEVKLRSAVTESLKFIECIVWQMLDKPIKVDAQFNIVKGLVTQLDLQNILSLNHDLVLESNLQRTGVDYFDGFGKKNLNVAEWLGFSDFKGDKIKICKLHGAIDWFSVRIKKHKEYNKIVKLPRNFYPESVCDLDDKIEMTNQTTPILLIGTFNKMLEYLNNIFELLYEEFKRTLKVTDLLIVSGYGFGDKGINSRLSFWLNKRKAHKMIIIHPDKKALLKQARGHFHKYIMSYNCIHPQVCFIEKKFENVTVEEIKDTA